MAGNIKDTKVNIIRLQAYNLVEDLENLTNQKISVDLYISDLQKKYKELYNTSKTLFQSIISQHKENKLDKPHFYFTLDTMLNYISKIQETNISQHDASVEIGSLLAKKYIPQLNEIEELEQKENKK
jgi:hypothetical protein